MALDISSLAGPATTLIPLVFSLGRLPYVFTDFSALILRGLSPIHQKSDLPERRTWSLTLCLPPPPPPPLLKVSPGLVAASVLFILCPLLFCGPQPISARRRSGLAFLPSGFCPPFLSCLEFPGTPHPPPPPTAPLLPVHNPPLSSLSLPWGCLPGAQPRPILPLLLPPGTLPWGPPPCSHSPSYDFTCIWMIVSVCLL